MKTLEGGASMVKTELDLGRDEKIREVLYQTIRGRVERVISEVVARCSHLRYLDEVETVMKEVVQKHGFIVNDGYYEDREDGDYVCYSIEVKDEDIPEAIKDIVEAKDKEIGHISIVAERYSHHSGVKCLFTGKDIERESSITLFFYEFWQDVFTWRDREYTDGTILIW